MKEEDRILKLKKIEERKMEMKNLKEQMKRFKQLKQNSVVQEYLNLQEQLQGKTIISIQDIQTSEMMQRSCDCTHDIWFFMGGRRVEYDYGPESRDSYYYEFDEDKVDIYLYYCLECFEQIQVAKKDNNEFLRNNKVLIFNKKYISTDDFRNYQKQYYRLLLTNESEKAIQKIIRRVK